MGALTPQYTTVSLMLSQWPAIGSEANVSSSQMAYIAGNAETVINAKLASQYTVPLSGSFPVIQTIATEMAVFDLLSSRLMTRKQLKETDWPNRRDRAMTLLNDIARGALTLVDSAGNIVQPTGEALEVYSDTMGYTPTFNEDSQYGQNIDPDKLDDIEDSRD